MSAHAQQVPRFSDYSARIYEGVQAPLKLQSSEARNYRTRLSQAYLKPINFGGRYVFATWGAGSGCETGAVLDVVSGLPFLLPFSACSSDPGRKPLSFRSDSRLLVITGTLDGRGNPGTRYLLFDGRQFQHLTTVRLEQDVAGAPAAPAQDSAASKLMCGKTVHRAEIEQDIDGRRIVVTPSHVSETGRVEWRNLNNVGNLRIWCIYNQYGTETRSDMLDRGLTECILENRSMTCFRRGPANLLAQLFGNDSSTETNRTTDQDIAALATFSKHPKIGDLWQCYDDGMQVYLTELAKTAPDERQFTLGVLAMGGFFSLGGDIRVACNQKHVGDLTKVRMNSDQQEVNIVFVAYLADQDRKLVDRCRSHRGDPAWSFVVAYCERMSKLLREQDR